MGFTNFNRLFGDNKDGLLKEAVIPMASPQTDAIVAATNVMFVDTQYLLLTVLQAEDPDLYGPQVVDNVDVVLEPKQQRNYVPVTIASLAAKIIKFVNAQLAKRPGLNYIFFGADNHTLVPVMKHQEWNLRSHHTSGLEGDTFSTQLKTDFSRSEESLGFGLDGPLGLTLTSNSPLTEEFLKDRYTRPLLLSKLFSRVFNEYVFVGAIDEHTTRDITLVLLHPMFSPDNTRVIDNAYTYNINGATLEMVWTSEKYTTGLEFGEADMQLVSVLRALPKETQQVEVVSNDTDTYIILLFHYVHMSKAEKLFPILVWGTGHNRVVDMQKLFGKTVPDLIDEIFKSGTLQIADKVLFFVLVCMLLYETDYYDKPANFSSSPEQLKRAMEEVAKVASFEPSGMKYIQFGYDSQTGALSMIGYDAALLRTLSQGLYCMALPSIRRKKGGYNLVDIGKEILSGKGPGVTDEVLAQLWRDFVENLGTARESQSIRMEHPLYKVVEDPNLLGDGMSLNNIISEKQLKSLTFYLLHAFRNETNKQLYENDHPSKQADEDFFIYIDALTGVTDSEWIARRLDTASGLTTRIAETEHTADYRAAWRIHDTVENVSRLTNSKTFPGELSPHHHFYKAAKVMWLATYFNTGCTRGPAVRADNDTGILSEDTARLIIDTAASPQLEPLMKLAGFRLCFSQQTGETTHVLRHEDAVTAQRMKDSFKTVIINIKPPRVHGIDLAPLLARTALFLFEAPIPASLQEEADEVAYFAAKLAELRVAFKYQLVMLSTNARAGWIKEFCTQMSNLKMKVDDKVVIYPDERLVFKKIFAEFLMDNDKSRGDFLLEPMPARFYTESKEEIAKRTKPEEEEETPSRVFVPTCRLAASELDAAADMQINSAFPYCEYKTGPVFEDPIMKNEMGEAAVFRGAVFRAETFIASGIVATTHDTTSEEDVIQWMPAKKNSLTCAPYYQAKSLMGAGHSMIEAREMLNTLMLPRQRDVSLVIDRHLMHVKAESNWHNRFYPTFVSTSLDAATYALPLLRYVHDVRTIDIWRERVFPFLHVFKRAMELSFRSFMDWKINQSLYLQSLIVGADILFRDEDVVAPATSEQVPPDMRFFSATWPMAIIKHFGPKQGLDINDEAAEEGVEEDKETFAKKLESIITDAAEILTPLCRFFPNTKNMFVKIDKASDEGEELKITMLFRGWHLNLLRHYLTFALNNLNKNDKLQQDLADLISNPVIVMKGLAHPIVIINLMK